MFAPAPAVTLAILATAPFSLVAPGSVVVVPPSVLRVAEDAAARAPRARADLHTEGTLPGRGIRDESIHAKADQPAVLALGSAWRTTGDRRFLSAAVNYLSAWARTYRPSFNPIDETGFDQMMLATDLLRKDMSPAARAEVDAFWRGMAVGYLAAMDGRPRNARTNWQSHRVKLAAMAAFATGDAALIARARIAFRRQIVVNVRPDGSVFDFGERDALHYVTYNLDPLLMAALAARAHGEDWYGWRSPDGAGLAAAVRWLDPYASGKRTHVEFARSRVRFDRERAAAGQREYAPHEWDRRNAISTYALSASLDARSRSMLERVVRETGARPAYWTGLLR